MTFKEALEIQKILTDKFLFSSSHQLEFAGVAEPEEFYNEYLSEVFKAIDGIGILHEGGRTGYKIVLYQTSSYTKVNAFRISNYMQVNEADIRVVATKPFQFLFARKRPLQIGCSISHLESSHFGTLGCFVSNNEGVFLLSNHHVLVNERVNYKNDYVIQPGYPTGKQRDIVGKLHSKLPFDIGGENEFDAAMAGPIDITVDTSIDFLLRDNGKNEGRFLSWLTYFFGHKKPKVFVTTTADPVLNTSVYKYGAVSGVTNGVIETFPANIKVRWVDGSPVNFRNQISIHGYGGSFSEAGDSGAVVLNNRNEAVGLVFAGNDMVTWANPITPVLSGLGVRLHF